MGERSDPVHVDEGLQGSTSSTAADPPGVELDPFANLEYSIFMIEKDSLTPPFFSLAASNSHVRNWESVPVITSQYSACQG